MLTPLSAQQLLSFCQSITPLPTFHIYPKVASTNTIAKALARSQATHGTVVLAEEQEAGEGRHRRSFHSPPGGVYLSVVLHPGELFRAVPSLLTVHACVTVADAIRDICGIEVGIKWVNDLLLEGRKVCGISCDTAIDPDTGKLSWAVLGIGINVATPESSFPPELRLLATSLDPQGIASIDRNRLIAQILRGLLAPTPLTAREELLRRYREALVVLQQRLLVQEGEHSYQATALDINREGNLIVRREDGTLVTLIAGEISTRPLTDFR